MFDYTLMCMALEIFVFKTRIRSLQQLIYSLKSIFTDLPVFNEEVQERKAALEDCSVGSQSESAHERPGVNYESKSILDKEIAFLCILPGSQRKSSSTEQKKKGLDVNTDVIAI